MKLKDQSKELAKMVDSISGIGNTPNLSDDLPEELEEREPIFTIDYSKEIKSSIKRARNSIKTIIKAIVPKDHLNDEYIKDKLEQDAESLGRLYYQEKLIEQVQRANIDTIGTGNLSPRMFEVFNQTSKLHSDISKQISDLQTQLRKSYIDLILDIKFKDSEEGNVKAIAQPQQPIAIENKEKPSEGDFSRVYVGTKDLISKLNKDKINKHKELSEAEEIG